MKSLTIPLDCARCSGRKGDVMCGKRLTCNRFLAGCDTLGEENEKFSVWIEPDKIGSSCKSYWPMDGAK